RKFVRNTSAVARSWSSTFRPSSRRRSSATERLPRFASAIDKLTPPLSVPIPWVMSPRYGSPSGRSIRMTSAPQSASSAPAPGTNTHGARSPTRSPSTAPSSVARSVLLRALHELDDRRRRRERTRDPRGGVARVHDHHLAVDVRRRVAAQERERAGLLVWA